MKNDSPILGGFMGIAAALASQPILGAHSTPGITFSSAALVGFLFGGVEGAGIALAGTYALGRMEF